MGQMKEILEEKKRSLFKAVSWRAVATTTAVGLIYVFSGKLELATSIGVGDVVLKLMFYYLRERGWNRITFGRNVVATIKSAN
jgi:adenylylsulfate kinase